MDSRTHAPSPAGHRERRPTALRPAVTAAVPGTIGVTAPAPLVRPASGGNRFALPWPVGSAGQGSSATAVGVWPPSSTAVGSGGRAGGSFRIARFLPLGP
jgi:hypothetical protein